VSFGDYEIYFMKDQSLHERIGEDNFINLNLMHMCGEACTRKPRNVIYNCNGNPHYSIVLLSLVKYWYLLE